MGFPQHVIEHTPAAAAAAATRKSYYFQIGNNFLVINSSLRIGFLLRASPMVLSMGSCTGNLG
jgi:hypothetical protein